MNIFQIKTTKGNNKPAISSGIDPYMWLVEKIEPTRTDLLNHSVYKQLGDIASVRIFMESHIFAIWDFMSLIKTLQQRVTCLDVPWLPPTDINSARMVNEIVLAEETDEVTPGHYTSHFDLYLTAMSEIGADSSSIRKFIDSLQQGFSAEEALAPLSIPESTKTFVLSTLTTVNKSTHEVAAAFLLGREDIVPAMFRQILASLESSHVFTYKSLQLYLDRHTFLDEDQHVPMGQKLLKNLCGDDPLKWEQALHSAHNALKVRCSLWDGVAQSIQENRENP
ncbi:DUF3050 domain-containing protein [Nostocaceae cyanobacterium CENA369]|uniref:DUF3050 domain-containing protein n=1 Tax=Dendronalium phyllosphericum CENA369 TaxID=1725256 RepID=A0A8J7I748_9NOST|nr:DUF3050 domain-containing protein [Dendronalium phyllosphericum]MBH8576070.1 DUF3050 domain-containing protein [Dendronalium phyllosphericum CENA369]